MLTKGLEPVWVKLIVIVTSLLLVTCLSMYTAAQWLAGKKFLSGAFGITEHISLLLFGLSIVGYSCLGGFRGSVYADVLQGMIRIFGTFVALAAVILFAVSDPDTFRRNFSGVSANYFSFFDGGLIASIGFILGFAAAAIGFGLGQPQIASRYMAGSSPSETQAARWIYIGFIQYTWISMTVFGVVLRGVMPDIVDPEIGLSVFFQKHIGGILTGIIFADVFATIASTSNGILVSIAQIVQRDLLQRAGPLHFSELNQILLTFVLGVCTIFLSIIVPGNVFSMAIDFVSIIGAGIAAPMMIRLFSWKHTGGSLFISIIGGILPATIWKVFGLDTLINEAAVWHPLQSHNQFRFELDALPLSPAAKERLVLPPESSFVLTIFRPASGTPRGDSR